MILHQQFTDVAENCDEFYSIHKGMVSSTNSNKNCYNCYNLKNGECTKGIENKSLLINEYF